MTAKKAPRGPSKRKLPGGHGVIPAELRYLYALLTFSGAEPAAESITYKSTTKCGVIEYDRDGVRYRLVVANPE